MQQRQTLDQIKSNATRHQMQPMEHSKTLDQINIQSTTVQGARSTAVGLSNYEGVGPHLLENSVLNDPSRSRECFLLPGTATRFGMSSSHLNTPLPLLITYLYSMDVDAGIEHVQLHLFRRNIIGWIPVVSRQETSFGQNFAHWDPNVPNIKTFHDAWASAQPWIALPVRMHDHSFLGIPSSEGESAADHQQLVPKLGLCFDRKCHLKPL
jgi:hypothetical protein